MRKRTALYSVVGLALAALAGCEERKSTPVEPVAEKDSVYTVPDSTLYGRLGEGTAMSCLEFITEDGDTLMLNKMSEYTGRYGEILGTIENYTDRFGITTTDNNESVGTAINVTQLAQTWKSVENRENGFRLDEGGKASPLSDASQQYSAWQLHNGRLLLYAKVMGEYGEEMRTDTATILCLDMDSLILRDRNNQVHKYHH